MAEKSSFSASFIGYSCKKGDEVKNINFFSTNSVDFYS
ncbi:hypothetical protein ADU38_233 [Streptococcus thermophilus]|nr:hypothetical protein ADU38_233 [Streptococcus thermophilus]